MHIEPTSLPGVMVIDLDRIEDARGWFARTFCRDEFAALDMNADVAQCNLSFNRSAGTLRGMHYQAAPHEESKVVRVTRGAIHDVAIDLRPDSPTYCRWHAEHLAADNHRALYIPEGCAHGFQTLVDDTEILYLMGDAYHAESARGVRWDDPAFGIDWPDPPHERIVADRDAEYPDFAP